MQHSPTAFVIIALLIVVKQGGGVALNEDEDLIAEETRHKSVTIVQSPKLVEKPKEESTPAPVSSTPNPELRPHKPGGPPLDKHGKKIYVEIPRQYYRHVQKIPPHHTKLHHHATNTVYKVIKVPPNSRNRIYSKPPSRLVFAASTGRPVIAKNPNPPPQKISIPVQTINGIPADVVRPPKFVETIITTTTTTPQPTTTTARLLRTKRIWPKRILEKMNETYPNFTEPTFLSKPLSNSGHLLPERQNNLKPLSNSARLPPERESVTKTVSNAIPHNTSTKNSTDNEVSASGLKYVYTNRSPSSTPPAPIVSTVRVYRRVTRVPKKKPSTPEPRPAASYITANYTKSPTNDWVPIIPSHFPKCPSGNKKLIIKKSHRRSDGFDETQLDPSEEAEKDSDDFKNVSEDVPAKYPKNEPKEDPENKPVDLTKNELKRSRRSAIYQTLPNPLDEEEALPFNNQPLPMQPDNYNTLPNNYDTLPAASNPIPKAEPISRKKTVFFRKRQRLNPLLYSSLRPVHVPPDYVFRDLQPEASHVQPKVVTKVKHHHHHHHHRYVQTIEKPVKVPVKVEVPKPFLFPVEKKVPVPYEKIKVVEKPVPYPVQVEKKVPVPVGIRVPVPYKVVEKEYVPKPYPVIQHVPVYKQVEVKVPQPVPVEVERKVPYPVRVKVPVPVEKPVPVPVTVEKKVPYPVPVKVLVPHPYPVETKVPVPYEVKEPVEVIKHVPVKVPVPQPYPVKVPQPIPVPYEKRVPYPVEVEKKVPYPVEVYVPQRVEVEKKIPIYIPKPYPVEKQVPYPVKVPYPVNVNGPYSNNQPTIVNNDLNDPYSIYKGLEDSLTQASSSTVNSLSSSFGTSSTMMPYNAGNYGILGGFGFQSRSDKPDTSGNEVTTPLTKNGFQSRSDKSEDSKSELTTTAYYVRSEVTSPLADNGVQSDNSSSETNTSLNVTTSTEDTPKP